MKLYYVGIAGIIVLAAFTLRRTGLIVRWIFRITYCPVPDKVLGLLAWIVVCAIVCVVLRIAT